MEYIELRSFDNHIEARTVMHMLQQSKVRCHLKDEHIQVSDPLLSSALAGTRLMVYHAHVEQAWDLMDKAEEKYLRTIPCPVCKLHALKAVSLTRKHSCKLSALASMMLNGHSIEITKIYQCTNCGYDFRDLSEVHGA